jgi:hypothetical protein
MEDTELAENLTLWALRDYFRFARYPGVFTISAFGLWQDAERRQAMSYSISTLLTRNLHDVFGENDSARHHRLTDQSEISRVLRSTLRTVRPIN